MSSRIDFKQIDVQKLSAVHDTSKFDCGNADINDFLRHDALLWQNKKLAVTRIFICNEEIIGFYCSSADSIRLKDDEKKEEKNLNEKKITEVPAIKIGRLGRSLVYKNCGLGDFILNWAIGHILEISESIGVRFITVDSYPDREKWYEHFNFRRNLHKHYQDKRNVSMRLCIFNPPKNTAQEKL